MGWGWDRVVRALSSGQGTWAARRPQSLWVLLPTRCGPLGYFIRAPGELMKGQHSSCLPDGSWVTGALFTCKRRQEPASLRDEEKALSPVKLLGGSQGGRGDVLTPGLRISSRA